MFLEQFHHRRQNFGVRSSALAQMAVHLFADTLQGFTERRRVLVLGRVADFVPVRV